MIDRRSESFDEAKSAAGERNVVRSKSCGAMAAAAAAVPEGDARPELEERAKDLRGLVRSLRESERMGVSTAASASVLLGAALKEAVGEPAVLALAVGEEEVGAIARAMQRHVRFAPLQLSGLKLLITLDKEVPALRSRVVSSGLPAVLGAMQSHPHEEDIQVKALKLLVNVSCSADASLQILVHRGVRAVGGAMERFRASRAVAEKACLLLHNLAAREDARREMLRQGVLELLFTVLQRGTQRAQSRSALHDLCEGILRKLVGTCSKLEASRGGNVVSGLLGGGAAGAEAVVAMDVDDEEEEGVEGEEEEDEEEEEEEEEDEGFEGAGADPPAALLRSSPSLRVASLLKMPDVKLSDLFLRPRRRPEDAVLRSVRGAVGRAYDAASLLGDGKFSYVFSAERRGGGGRVAVKAMARPWGKMNDGQRFAVAREVGILHFLEHVHVLQVLDCAFLGDICCIAFPLCGTDAHRLVAEGGALGMDACAALCAQLLRALAYCHGCRVIHRDIKPENLLLAPAADGQLHLRLGDFGFARMLSDGDPLSLPLGTFGYVAPEVLFGDGYGTGVDIWASGACALRLLLGFGRRAGGEAPAPFDDLSRRFQGILRRRRAFVAGGGLEDAFEDAAETAERRAMDAGGAAEGPEAAAEAPQIAALGTQWERTRDTLREWRRAGQIPLTCPAAAAAMGAALPGNPEHDAATELSGAERAAFLLQDEPFNALEDLRGALAGAAAVAEADAARGGAVREFLSLALCVSKWERPTAQELLERSRWVREAG